MANRLFQNRIPLGGPKKETSPIRFSWVALDPVVAWPAEGDEVAGFQDQLRGDAPRDEVVGVLGLADVATLTPGVVGE